MRSTPQSIEGRPPSPVRLAIVLLLVASTLSSGCSRAFWRNQADCDVYSAEAERLNDPRWMVPRLTIQPDPRSRFFHPYDPDRPPLPPDDPAAHVYMHSLNGMENYKGWHKFGRALSVENPLWLAPFGLQPPPEAVEAQPVDGDGEAGSDETQPQSHTNLELLPGGCPAPGIENLTLAQAIELAHIHSREYQTVIEDLYLAALILTFDRFQFDVRYLGFGGQEPTSDLEFESIPGVRDTLTLNNRFGVSQLLPSGAQWIVEIANNTLWVFGDEGSNTATVLSYSLVQPLLFGAGRKVVLESLTQSERNVLYAVRDLARFRQVFFTDIVSDGPSGGYLGLLQQRQGVINQQDNIRRVIEQLEQLRTTFRLQRPLEISEPLDMLPEGLEFPPAVADQIRYDADARLLYWRGEITPEQTEILQNLSEDNDWLAAVTELIQRLEILATEPRTQDVLQLESRLLRQQSGLRGTERLLQDNLDLYKIQLGLPPDFRITLDEELLKPFQLIDPSVIEMEQRVKDFSRISASFDPDSPELADPADLRDAVRDLESLVEQVRERPLASVQRDLERAKAELRDDGEAEEGEEWRQGAVEAIERDIRLVLDDLRTVDQLILDARMIVFADDPTPDQKSMAIRIIGGTRDELLRAVRNLQGPQSALRAQLIPLEEFDMPLEDTIGFGLANRVDLMNSRAFVMDARRKVEVAANALQAVLNLRVEGDVRTPPDGDNPFDFRGENSSFRVGVGFQAPLDQVAERNAYRASLIDYHRARRDYMEFEDNVKFQIRQSWRQLQVLRRNFQIAQQAVRISAQELDSAVELANAPQQAGQQGRNQGLNLINALNNVLAAQNDLIDIWVDYERARLNIFRDMGIMNIDARGVWEDPFYQRLAPPQDCLFGLPVEESEISPELAPPPAPSPLPGTARLEPLPSDDRSTLFEHWDAHETHDPQPENGPELLPARIRLSSAAVERGTGGNPVGRSGGGAVDPRTAFVGRGGESERSHRGGQARTFPHRRDRTGAARQPEERDALEQR